MKIYFTMFALLMLAAAVFADPIAAVSKIGTLDAGRFYGQEMIVTGTVAQVSIRPAIVFLNMDKPYPKSPFTLVIFPAATNQFGNLNALKGASVEAKGKIINYHNRPEIVLQKASQLKVTAAASNTSGSPQ